MIYLNAGGPPWGREGMEGEAGITGGRGPDTESLPLNDGMNLDEAD